MKSIAAILILGTANFSAAQSPLDQPSQKTITVGSEIKRGYDETAAVSHASGADSANILQHAVDSRAAISRNQSQNTDSDGFLLGASLARYIDLSTWLHIPGILKLNSAENVQLVREDAAETLLKMRELQKKLGTDDDALFSAAGFKNIEKAKELIAKFESRGDAAAQFSPPPEIAESIQPKSEMRLVTVSQPVTVPSEHGNITLPSGSRVQFVSREGSDIRIRYAGKDLLIPSSAVSDSAGK
jgi:hypothetical protein